MTTIDDAPATISVNDLTLEVTANGVTERIRFGSFSAVDARAFRAEMGMPLVRAFVALHDRTNDWDTDLLAGIVWLHRRKESPGLRWEDVAEKVTYDDAVRSRSVTAAGNGSRPAGEDDVDPS